VWKIEIHVHDHVATLQHPFEGTTGESWTENKATPARGFVLDIREVHFHALRGAGRGRGPAAARQVNDLSAQVGLDPPERSIPLFDLDKNLAADQVVKHAL
jgi:hypothetical protein